MSYSGSGLSTFQEFATSIDEQGKDLKAMLVRGSSCGRSNQAGRAFELLYLL